MEEEQDLVVFDEILFAKKEVRLEEEQDLSSSTRSSLQSTKWLRLEESQDLVILDEIFFAKNDVPLEESSQDLVLSSSLCGGSCHLSPEGKVPGYVSKRIEKSIL